MIQSRSQVADHGHTGLRRVAIFDAHFPASLAFARSLGRAGVPTTVFSHEPRAAARYSRHVSALHPCPDVANTDPFVDWLTEAKIEGRVDLVAPTSDALVFALAEVHDRLGDPPHGHPTPRAVRDCLFKDWFAERMAVAGFPAAPSETPTSIDAALAAAERLGYPVMLKPRSHVAVGSHRGDVAGTPAKLAELFRPYVLGDVHRAALRHNPHLSLPLLQRYYPRDEVDVVSISGCLDANGAVVSIGHARKLREWGRGRGVGTRFESLPAQPFTAAAVEAVHKVLGTGLFEFEVLVHHPTGNWWAIDLNPRGYGQITLEIGRGNDLPMRWYACVTGVELLGTPARRRQPQFWQAGLPYYADMAISIARGPRRLVSLRELVRSLAQPRVGAVLDVRDPGPALVHAAAFIRHPGSLVRPFLRRTFDREVSEASRRRPQQPERAAGLIARAATVSQRRTESG